MHFSCRLMQPNLLNSKPVLLTWEIPFWNVYSGVIQLMVLNSELDGTLCLVLELQKGAVETLTFLEIASMACFSKKNSISYKIHCFLTTFCTFVTFTSISEGCFRNTSVSSSLTNFKTHSSEVIFIHSMWYKLIRQPTLADFCNSSWVSTWFDKLISGDETPDDLGQSYEFVLWRKSWSSNSTLSLARLCIPITGELSLLSETCCCSFCSNVLTYSSLFLFLAGPDTWACISLFWTSQMLCFFSIP